MQKVNAPVLEAKKLIEMVKFDHVMLSGNISHMTRIDYKKFPYFVRLIFALLVQLSKKTG